MSALGKWQLRSPRPICGAELSFTRAKCKSVNSRPRASLEQHAVRITGNTSTVRRWGFLSLPASWTPRGADGIAHALDNRPCVFSLCSIVENLLKNKLRPVVFEMPRVNGRDGNDSHHPPRGPGCLLRIGRAAARAILERQTDCRRRRGCACRFLRGEGLRRPRRHAGTARARTLSATHLCRRPFQGLPTARRCRHRA